MKLWFASLVGLLCIPTGAWSQPGSDPKWKPKTSIESRSYIMDPALNDGYAGATKSSVVYSPNGRYFFTLARRGDLACDCNIFDLTVFDALGIERAFDRSAGRAPGPVASLSLRSKTNDSAIGAPRWTSDGTAIAFLGVKDSGEPQVYRWEPTAQKLKQLTNWPEHIISFEVAGDSVIFSAITRSVKIEMKAYPASVVETRDFAAAFGLDREYFTGLFSATSGETPQRIGPEYVAGRLPIGRMWISPRGDKAIVQRNLFASEVPSTWDAFPESAFHKQNSSGNINTYAQLFLVDLKSHTERPLLQAPGANILGFWAGPQVVWRPDNQTVIASGQLLPPEIAGFKQSKFNLLSVDSMTSKYEILDSSDDATQQIESLLDQGAAGVEVNRRSGTRGRILQTAHGLRFDPAVAPDQTVKPGSLKVEVEQGLNAPPRLIARTGTNTLFLDAPDPALAGVVPSRSERFDWIDNSGRRWSGALTLPTTPAERLPLVIQVGHVALDQFRPDGSATTAFAAQSLASHGIAVLEVDRDETGGFGTQAESAGLVDGLDAAVSKLAERGIVDQEKVGLVGFSRTGWLVGQVLTHPAKTRISAAVMADPGDPSYIQYLQWYVMGVQGITSQYEAANGGGDFWANKDGWLKNATGFNLDRVVAPVLLTANGQNNLTSSLETYSGLKLLKKPVEFYLFPEGSHQLRRPRERLASMTLTIDWMRFWLQGVEDSDQAKAAQYVRWRKLRHDRDVAASRGP